jgi:hypothetical protein
MKAEGPAATDKRMTAVTIRLSAISVAVTVEM